MDNLAKEKLIEQTRATRFPVNRPPAPHTQKGPYLVPLLRKFLEKQITYTDPETKIQTTEKAKDAILKRLILNAAGGEISAIKEILERFDGKVLQETKVSGQVDSSTKIIVIYPPEYKPKEVRVGTQTQVIPSRLF